jgi:hypothetical protein
MRNETKCIAGSQQITLENTVSWRVFDPDKKNLNLQIIKELIVKKLSHTTIPLKG